MFEIASRQKIRFETNKGIMTTDDLWDLPLVSNNPKVLTLDEIARDLHKQLKNGDDVSFVVPERKSDSTKQLKFDIVKHIIDVKLAEQADAVNSRAKAEQNQTIMAIIAQREAQELASLPTDELKKMIKP